MKKLFFVMFAALMLFSLIACSSDVKVVSVSGITAENLSIDATGSTGGSAEITYTISPANASDKSVKITLATTGTATDHNMITPSDYATITDKTVKVTQTNKHFYFDVNVTSVANPSVSGKATVYVNFTVPTENVKSSTVTCTDAALISGTDISLYTGGNYTTATILTSLSDYEYPWLKYTIKDVIGKPIGDSIANSDDGERTIQAINCGEATVTVSSAHKNFDENYAKTFKVYVNRITTKSDLVAFLSNTDKFAGATEAYLANSLKIDETLEVQGTKTLYLNENTIDFTTNTAFHLNSGAKFAIEGGKLNQEVAGIAKMFTNEYTGSLKLSDTDVLVSATDEAYVTDIERELIVNGGKYKVNATTATVFKVQGAAASIKYTDVSVTASKSAVVADAQYVKVINGKYEIDSSSSTVFKSSDTAEINSVEITVNAENAVVIDTKTITKASGKYVITATDSATVFKASDSMILNSPSVTVAAKNANIATEAIVKATAGKYDVNAEYDANGFICKAGSEIKGVEMNVKASTHNATAIKICGGAVNLDKEYTTSSEINVLGSGDEANGFIIDSNSTLNVKKALTLNINGKNGRGIFNNGTVNCDKSLSIVINSSSISSTNDARAIVNNSGATFTANDILTINTSTANKGYGVVNSGTFNAEKGLAIITTSTDATCIENAGTLTCHDEIYAYANVYGDATESTNSKSLINTGKVYFEKVEKAGTTPTDFKGYFVAGKKGAGTGTACALSNTSNTDLGIFVNCYAAVQFESYGLNPKHENGNIKHADSVDVKYCYQKPGSNHAKTEFNIPEDL